jgi:hypothetical protein
MEVVFRRKFKFAPPPWRVFDALVNEIPAWWLSRPGERLPDVVASDRPSRVVYRSPVLDRPDDVVELIVDTDGGPGSQIVLTNSTPSPVTGEELARLRHRWGHHLGGELRDWLDHGTPVGTSNPFTWCPGPDCRPSQGTS